MRALGSQWGSVRSAERLTRYAHAYDDRVVWLDMWVVTAWSGEPQGLDGQAIKWVDPPALDHEDILAADWPIVAALNSWLRVDACARQ